MSEYCGWLTEVPAQVILSKAQRDRRKDHEGQLGGRQRKDPKSEGAGKLLYSFSFHAFNHEAML